MIRTLTTTLGTALTAVLLTATSAFAEGTIPNPKPEAPAGLQSQIDKLLNLLMYFGLAAVVAGFIGAGISLALARQQGHGGGREGIDRVLYVCGGAIIIGSASALAGWLL
jgi:hypothetical protein